jgi:DNA polymerase (family 10)
MPVQNSDIAKIFNQLADLLEIKGDNPFRIRAYRMAARNIGSLSDDVREMIKNGKDLTEISGIGKDLAEKIGQIVKSGGLSQLEEIKKEVPAALIDLMKIEGLGPKRTGVLYEKLGIENIDELEKAAEKGKIKELEGFGEKTEENILREIKRGGAQKGEKARIKLADAEELAGPLIKYLKQIDGVKKIEIAGSYRRGRETVGDLDILVTHMKGSDVMQRFVDYEDVERVLAKGQTKSSVLMKSNLQVDLRAVPEVSYGAALHYFTGSKEHNIEIRKMGMEKGLKINEYGVFKDDQRIAGKTEKEVFAQVGLPYIEPELRENRGELEAAQDNKLPQLIEIEDIRGDLHTHTDETDGRSSLEQMAQAAVAKGYEYLAICDHSKRVSVSNGMDEKRLSEQIDQIERLNEKLDKIVLLKSIEVEILEDGSLDLPDRILKRLDLVVCAVHYKFRISREKQTERIIKGISNPYVTILSHPTGRLINRREPYELDMESLMKAAKDTGCALELNAQPERMDLNDLYCKMAKENGVMIVISTDAHSTDELNMMKYGIKQARRGWIEADDVLNTKNLQQLLKWIKNRR